MKYKKYLKEKILEGGRIYEILSYQKTTNLFKIKMEEGAIRRLVWNAIADMHWKKAKRHGIVYIGREMPRFCRR